MATTLKNLKRSIQNYADRHSNHSFKTKPAFQLVNKFIAVCGEHTLLINVERDYRTRVSLIGSCNLENDLKELENVKCQFYIY
jgi:hypothetical protein